MQRNISVCSTVDGSCARTRYLTGNSIEITNARGYITTTQYLAYGSPEQTHALNILSPESVTTSLGYNLYGNTTSISQGSITETRLYDANQNLCKVIRPETAQTLFNRNALGELQWSIEGFNGSTTDCESTASASNKASFVYDNWGSLKTIDYADTTPDVWYVRDTQGNVLFAKTGTLVAGSISTPLTQWAYTYNSLNAIESETMSVDDLTFTINPEYNALGHISSLIYPSGLSINTNPNALGRPRSAGSYASNASYHPNGLFKNFSYGNGIVFSQTLDAERRPDIVNIAGSGLYLDYGYDSNNNVAGISSNDAQYSVSGLSYDGLDRLRTANGVWGSGSFTYDSLSNLKTQSVGTSNYVYTYNAQNRLESISGSINKPVYYDARGNLTRNGFQGLVFNSANELISGNGASYLYDANHRLVRKSAGGISTYSVYDSSGALISQYKSGVFTDFIKVGKSAIAKKTGSTVTYQHTDILGSTLAESNASGSITQKWHYLPFGERKESFSSDDTGYTGHQFDTSLGLTYALARYLDQVLGRFISNDPLGFTASNVQSFNRYAYGNNNPYRYVDPDGRAPNQAGVATIETIKAEINQYEKAGMSGAAVMSALSENHGSNTNRYLYTDKHGWVDMRHFGAAAAMASSTGSLITETLGFGNEVVQYLSEWGDDYRSGFSPEDISSNAAGAAFGDDYMNKGTVSESFDKWLKDAGARNPTDPAAQTSKLPATDPAARGGANRGSSNLSNSNNCPDNASNCS